MNRPVNRRQFLRTLLLGAGTAALSPTIDCLLPRLAQAAAPLPFDVYLTFDDGPTTEKDLSGPTTEVLDLLKAEGIPASFFVHGRSINDWEGPILARIIREGHALGNHLWRQGGNTVLDETKYTILAQQYFEAEIRIRTILQAADVEAYERYLSQPHMYRRPGGNNGLTPFLDLKNYRTLEYSKTMRGYLDKLPWLKGVYDYSGWHALSGDGIPAIRAHPTTPEEAIRWTLDGGFGYYGVNHYLCTDEPPRRSLEARDGLVILLHDAAELCRKALPTIIFRLRALGATFKALPRPVDEPNSKTVGIGYAPTPDPKGAVCQ